MNGPSYAARAVQIVQGHAAVVATAMADGRIDPSERRQVTESLAHLNAATRVVLAWANLVQTRSTDPERIGELVGALNTWVARLPG